MTHDRGRNTAIATAAVGLLVLALAAVYVLPAFLPDERGRRLDGVWELRLPAGYTHEITLETIDDGLYHLNRLVFAGLYVVEDDHLVMKKPLDDRLTEFRWKILDSGSLKLVDQPPSRKTGADYLGATMTRKR